MSRWQKETRGRSRIREILVLLAWSGFLLAGCSDDEPTGVIDDIQTNHTHPNDFVGAFAQAWSDQSVQAMDALLASNFEFAILEGDQEDLAWITDGRWDRAQEMTIVEHMMDANYTGDEPPVDVIEMAFTVLNSDVADGLRELTANAEITILVGPDEGWFSDTRFILTLREDGDGFLRLVEMREIRPLLRSPIESSIQVQAFGVVKSRYR